MRERLGTTDSLNQMFSRHGKYYFDDIWISHQQTCRFAPNIYLSIIHLTSMHTGWISIESVSCTDNELVNGGNVRVPIHHGQWWLWALYLRCWAQEGGSFAVTIFSAKASYSRAGKLMEKYVLAYILYIRDVGHQPLNIQSLQPLWTEWLTFRPTWGRQMLQRSWQSQSEL